MKAKTLRDYGLPSGHRRIALIAVVGILLGTLSAVSVRAQEIEPDGDDDGRIGRALYDAGNYQAAVDYYTKLLKGRNAFTDANFARGNCYEALKNWQAAIADYNIVLKKKPKLYDAYVERGRSYAGLGDLSAAKQDLTTAITLKPERSDAYQVLGDTLFTGKDYEGAIANYTKFIALEPKPEPVVFQNRGEANFAAKHYAAAITDFDRFVAFAPKGAGEVALKRGDSYMALKQFPEAIRAYTDYIAVHPEDKSGTALNNRALAEFQDHNFKAAKVDFKAYLKINPNDEIARNNLMSMYATSGRPTLSDLEEVLQKYPTDLTIRAVFAKELAEAKRFPEAIAQYDLILATKPDDYEIQFNRGLVEAKSGDHAKAVADFKVYTAAKPNDPLGWQSLGLEYGQQRNWKGAVAAFSQCISLRPDDVEAYKNRGLAEFNLRDSKATVRDLGKFNAVNPGDAQIKKLLTVAMFGLDDPYEDMRTALAQTKARPDDSASWSALGDAYISAKMYEPAIDAFTRAITLKKDETLLFKRGHAYYFLGATEPTAYMKAASDAKDVLGLKPDYAEAQLLKADSEYAAKDYKEAKADYVVYLALSGISEEDKTYAEKQSLRTAIDNEDYASVIAETTALIARKPDDASNYELRGATYVAQKNYILAILDMTVYTIMKPDDAEGFYNLGVAYAGKGDNLAAGGAYEKSLAVKPTYFDAAKKAALAYKAVADADASDAVKCGPEYDKAITLFDKAATIKGTGKDASDALSNEATALEAKARNTNTKEPLRAAVTVWNRYIAATPNASNLDKVRAHVDALKKQIADK